MTQPNYPEDLRAGNGREAEHDVAPDLQRALDQAQMRYDAAAYPGDLSADINLESDAKVAVETIGDSKIHDTAALPSSSVMLPFRQTRLFRRAAGVTLAAAIGLAVLVMAPLASDRSTGSSDPSDPIEASELVAQSHGGRLVDDSGDRPIEDSTVGPSQVGSPRQRLNPVAPPERFVNQWATAPGPSSVLHGLGFPTWRDAWSDPFISEYISRVLPREDARRDETNPSRGTICGLVLDTDGMPAAGSEVWAVNMEGEARFIRRVFRTQTNDRGHFQLAVPAGECFVWARRGNQFIQARHHSLHIEVQDRTAHWTEIRLADGVILQGVVRNATTGEPIPGAQLWLSTGESIEADDQGEYFIEGLPRGAMTLRTVTPGYVRDYVMIDTDVAIQSLDLSMTPGIPLRVRVQDEAGESIADAVVGHLGSGNRVASMATRESTDETGHTVVGAVEPGHRVRWVQAQAPGFESGIAAFVDVPTQGDLPEIVITLTRETDSQDAIALRTIVGHIRGPDGEAVANARVRWGMTSYEQASFPSIAFANDRGRFTLRNVPDIDGHVSVLAEGLAPIFVSVGAGEKTCEVEMENGRHLTGVVVDSAGQPVAGVSVYPSLGHSYGWGELAVTTDASGKWSMDGLPERFGLSFLGPDNSDLRNVGVSRNKHLITQVERPGGVRGRVIDAQGRPVRNFRILFGMPHEQNPGDDVGGFFAGCRGTGFSLTSDDGRFELRQDLGVGKVVRITATAPGFADASVDRYLVVPYNELVQEDELVLQLQTPVPWQLTVRGPDGPVANARVFLVDTPPGRLAHRGVDWYHDRNSWGRSILAHADAQGVVRFANVPFSSARVLVEAPGFARRAFALNVREDVGIENAEIELEREATLEVKVSNADGQLVDDVWVRITGPSPADDSDVRYVQDSATGTYRFDQLPAGDYVVKVGNNADMSMQEETILLREGADAATRLTLDGGQDGDQDGAQAQDSD